jgi:hypothetical protein
MAVRSFDLRADGLEYIFLAPEQFNNTETLARVKQSKPSLFVVDKAHCISEWVTTFGQNISSSGRWRKNSPPHCLSADRDRFEVKAKEIPLNLNLGLNLGRLQGMPSGSVRVVRL